METQILAGYHAHSTVQTSRLKHPPTYTLSVRETGLLILELQPDGQASGLTHLGACSAPGMEASGYHFPFSLPCSRSPVSPERNYWVGQKVRLGFSIRCYRKTRMNFLANPIVYSSVASIFVTPTQGTSQDHLDLVASRTYACSSTGLYISAYFKSCCLGV